MAATLQEVFETIEDVLAVYVERQVKRLINGNDLSDSELHVLRGKAQAMRDIRADLRTRLGYSVKVESIGDAI